MKFIFLGSCENGISFRFIDEHENIKDFGVQDTYYEKPINLEEYILDIDKKENERQGIELISEKIEENNFSIYFSKVDFENNEEFISSCKKYLNEKQGYNLI